MYCNLQSLFINAGGEDKKKQQGNSSTHFKGKERKKKATKQKIVFPSDVMNVC